MGNKVGYSTQRNENHSHDNHQVTVTRDWTKMGELGGDEYAASSSSPSSSSCVSGLSSAQRCALHCALPTDLLHLIYSHLPLRDRLHAALTCKHWLTAARRDRLSKASFRFVHNHRGRSINDRPCCSIPLNLARSSLRHWVTSLDVQRVPMPSLSLHHLACALELPRLHSLTYFLDPASIRLRLDQTDAEGRLSSRPALLHIPRTLTSLNITINFYPHHETMRQCHRLLMQALSRILSLHSLRMSVESAALARPTNEDWSMLPSMTNLRHLHVATYVPNHDLYRAVKMLPSLQSFHVEPTSPRHQLSWAIASLKVLCQPPHQLHQLQSLTPWMNTKLTAGHMEQLTNLPNLTRLTPSSFSIDALAFLPQFHHLHELTLCIPRLSSSPTPDQNVDGDGDGDGDVDGDGDEKCGRWMDVAARYLTACPALTSVTLWILVGFHDRRLDILLRSLTHLRKFKLHCYDWSSDAYHPEQTLQILTHVAGALEELHLVMGVWQRPKPLPCLPSLPLLHTLIVQKQKMYIQSRWYWAGGSENTQQDEEEFEPEFRYHLMTLMNQMGTTIQRTPNLTTIKIGKAAHDVSKRITEVVNVEGDNTGSATSIAISQHTGATTTTHRI